MGWDVCDVYKAGIFPHWQFFSPLLWEEEMQLTRISNITSKCLCYHLENKWAAVDFIKQRIFFCKGTFVLLCFYPNCSYHSEWNRREECHVFQCDNSNTHLQWFEPGPLSNTNQCTCTTQDTCITVIFECLLVLQSETVYQLTSLLLNHQLHHRSRKYLFLPLTHTHKHRVSDPLLLCLPPGKIKLDSWMKFTAGRRKEKKKDSVDQSGKVQLH